MKPRKRHTHWHPGPRRTTKPQSIPEEVGVESLEGGGGAGMLNWWLGRQSLSRSEADNLWLGLNSFPLWLLLEKEEKTANTDPSIQSNLSRWPGLLYRLQYPLPGMPSRMPASGVWNSPVSFSSKGKDEQWPSPGTGSEQFLPSLHSLHYLLRLWKQPQAIPANTHIFPFHPKSPISSHFL